MIERLVIDTTDYGNLVSALRHEPIARALREDPIIRELDAYYQTPEYEALSLEDKDELGEEHHRQVNRIWDPFEKLIFNAYDGWDGNPLNLPMVTFVWDN